MSTYSTQPINKSFLSNNKFEFTLVRIPNFSFFVQTVNLPSMTLGVSEIQTPFTAVREPGTIISFGLLTLTFIVDEDMQSWYELYDWMIQLGNPEGFNKRGTLTGEEGKLNHITSDGSLIVKTNANNPNWKVTYKDLFPTDLGEINFSTTDTQEFITSSATFAYTSYELTRAITS